MIEELLSKLRKVKGRNGSFTACCPAHQDDSPSLAIREANDGRVLLHCFGGCSVHDVLGAVGMDITDLFPDKSEHHHPKIKPRFFASDLLRIIERESLIVSIVANDIAQGKDIPDADRERCLVARERIREALDHV